MKKYLGIIYYRAYKNIDHFPKDKIPREETPLVNSQSKLAFRSEKNNGMRFLEESSHLVSHETSTICNTEAKVSWITPLHAYLPKKELPEKRLGAIKSIILTTNYLRIIKNSIDGDSLRHT